MSETLRRLNELDVAVEKKESFTSFNDAVNGLKPFLLTTESIDPSEIGFQFNGSARFKLGENDYPTTSWGIKSLCKILKIPDPFAKAIPVDLLKYNIDRLSKVYTVEGGLTVSFDTDGNIVGFTKPSYRPLRNIDLLPRLADRFKDIENTKVEVSVRNVIASFTNDMVTEQLEPVVGDVTKCGVEITNSELGDLDAKANLFLLRLVCTNGALLTDNWGAVSRNKNNRIQYDTVLDQFVVGCTQLNTDRKSLVTVYNKLPDVELDSKQFITTFKALKPSLGKQAAAEILQSNLEEIKDYENFEKKRTRWSAAASEWYGHSPRNTEKNSYEVFNNITQTARDLSSRDHARQLRAYSGRYLWMLAKDMEDVEIA